MSVRVFAPAKVNLTLQVGCPLADGMHPLQSVVMFADVGDWVEAAPRQESSLRVTGPFAQDLESRSDRNIVWSAMEALRREAGIEAGAEITLEKNLPVASGVGGGSSDAAAALKALNAVWRLGFSDIDLMRVAVTLGADVPVCVPARSAWMTGVGDAVAPLSAPPLHAVLVNPLKPLRTADVFRRFDALGLGRTLSDDAPPVWRSPQEAAEGAAALGNDLVAAASDMLPDISEIVSVLAATPGVLHASLSGSGATCFALFAAEADAAACATELAARRRDWWVKATSLGVLDPKGGGV